MSGNDKSGGVFCDTLHEGEEETLERDGKTYGVIKNKNLGEKLSKEESNRIRESLVQLVFQEAFGHKGITDSGETLNGLGMAVELNDGESDMGEQVEAIRRRLIETVDIIENAHCRVAIMVLTALSQVSQAAIEMGAIREDSKDTFEGATKGMLAGLYEGIKADFLGNLDINVRRNIDDGFLIDFLGEDINEKTRREIEAMLKDKSFH